MHAWLPSQPLLQKLGRIEGVTLEVVHDWEPSNLPESRARVEVIIPPQNYAGDLGDVIAELPCLKVVHALSTGVDRLADAIPAYIRLYNATGVHTAATAEWVLAAMLSCQRGFPEFRERQGVGRWEPSTFPGLGGASVAIVGAGEIGTAVATRLIPFGCSVHLVSRRPREGRLALGFSEDALALRGTVPVT
jgi:phosphoglycerate dehydrogenase-like enzyme